MLVNGEPIGAVLAANKHGGVGFDADDARLLQIFAGQLAVVLANARLQYESRTHHGEVRMLQRISALVRVNESLDTIIRSVLEAVAEFYASEIVAVDFLDMDSGRLVMEPSHVTGVHLDNPLVADAYSYGFEKSVVISGQPFLSNNVPNDPQVLLEYRAMARDLGLQRVILAPLQIGGRGIGELWAGNRRDGNFTPHDLDVLFSVAMQLSGAIERARLYTTTDDSLHSRVEVLDALGRVSNELNLTVELERVTDVIRHEALRITRADECTVLLLTTQEAWSDIEAPEFMGRRGGEDLFEEPAAGRRSRRPDPRHGLRAGLRRIAPGPRAAGCGFGAGRAGLLWRETGRHDPPVLAPAARLWRADARLRDRPRQQDGDRLRQRRPLPGADQPQPAPRPPRGAGQPDLRAGPGRAHGRQPGRSPGIGRPCRPDVLRIQRGARQPAG